MWLLWFIVYMLIGAALCAVYVYLASGLYEIDHEYDVLIGVLTGLFFPVVAPFSITVIVVKRIIESKD